MKFSTLVVSMSIFTLSFVGIANQAWAWVWSDPACSLTGSTQPVAGDIDADGDTELVMVSPCGKLYAISPDGSVEWARAVSPHPYVRQDSTPAIFDQGNDGILDIFVITKENNDNSPKYVLDGYGNLLAVTATEGAIQGSPTVSDTDGDGIYTFFLGTGHDDEDVRKVYAFDLLPEPDGYGHDYRFEEKWRLDLAEDFTLSGIPAVANLDSDANPEVVVTMHTWGGSAGAKKIYTLNSATGNTQWTYVTGEARNQYHVYADDSNAPVVVDLNGDGHPEILQTSYDAVIYALSHDTGDLLWSFQGAADSSHQTPSAGDLDGDGYLDIVFGTMDRVVTPGDQEWGSNYFYALDHEGQEKWSLNLGEDYMSIGSPAIGDLNGDGSPQIVVFTTTNPNVEGSHPHLYVLSGGGDVILDLALAPGIDATSTSAILVDLDGIPSGPTGGQTLEICYGHNVQDVGRTLTCLNHDGTDFIRDASVPTMEQLVWPVKHHDLMNSGAVPIPDDGPGPPRHVFARSRSEAF